MAADEIHTGDSKIDFLQSDVIDIAIILVFILIPKLWNKNIIILEGINEVELDNRGL